MRFDQLRRKKDERTAFLQSHGVECQGRASLAALEEALQKSLMEGKSKVVEDALEKVLSTTPSVPPAGPASSTSLPSHHEGVFSVEGGFKAVVVSCESEFAKTFKTSSAAEEWLAAMRELRKTGKLNPALKPLEGAVGKSSHLLKACQALEKTSSLEAMTVSCETVLPRLRQKRPRRRPAGITLKNMGRLSDSSCRPRQRSQIFRLLQRRQPRQVLDNFRKHGASRRVAHT